MVSFDINPEFTKYTDRSRYTVNHREHNDVVKLMTVEKSSSLKIYTGRVHISRTSLRNYSRFAAKKTNLVIFQPTWLRAAESRPKTYIPV